MGVAIDSRTDRVSVKNAVRRNAAADLSRVRKLEDRNQFDAAAVLCRGILAQNADSFDAWFLLSSIEHRRGPAYFLYVRAAPAIGAGVPTP